MHPFRFCGRCEVKYPLNVFRCPDCNKMLRARHKSHGYRDKLEQKLIIKRI